MTLFKNKYSVESTRLPNRDYSQNGWYFVTICTYEREWLFGDVVNGQVHLSEIGKIAEKFWVEIPQHSQHTYIDAYVIMPNHVHGIIIIDNPECREISESKDVNQCRDVTQCRDVPWNVSTTSGDDFDDTDVYRNLSKISPKAGSLSVIIRSYKAAVTRWCKMNGYSNFAWQQRFFDKIIRADGSVDKIREYIINNPLKWEYDKNNPSGLWM
ncbi:transposase [Nodularia spumigena CENA596]|uniref:Transposase n=1 Tax=Nodularia spumigena CENA596 TaxID=1819295 RepID=A0A166J9T4_NODSP|nr:transposase [Nodularia spumigena]KZL49421.1 transposase [Nodularia spumigena CENA596]